MTFVKKNILVALLAASTGAAFAAPVLVTIEAAKVTNTTATFTTKGVETFDEQTAGLNKTFTTAFGTTGISGTYTGVDIAGQNQYGGATGNYALTSTNRAGSNALYTLTLSQSVNYFGFFLSALDAGNQVAFYSGNTEVFSFSPTDVLAMTGNCTAGATNAYCGNPVTGQNTAQPYGFLNFFAQSGTTFDRIVFTETVASSGYESDNHTVGLYTSTSGTALNNVPEPGSLALLGLGLIGLAAARKRKQA